MKKSRIITLAAVLFVLCGVLVLVAALPDPGDTEPVLPSSDDQTKLGELIYSVEQDSIDYVSVTYASSGYNLQKNDYLWLCPDRPSIGISTSRATRLVTEIASLRYNSKLDASTVAPEDCGISDKSDTVSFNSNLGSISIYLGTDVPDSDLCYIMTSTSDDIYMVEKEDVSLMFAPLDDYRNDELLFIDFENITSVDYSGIEASFRLKKGSADTGNGDYYEWDIISPISLSANDESVVTKLIDPVRQAQIITYASDDGNYADFGLGNRQNYVKFSDSKGDVQTVYFGTPVQNKRYISINDSKSIYEVSTLGAQFSSLNLIDVANRILYVNKQNNIRYVTIDGSDRQNKIEFTSGGETIVDGIKADSNKSREVFSYICGLLADDISTSPLSGAGLTITYHLADSTSVVLTFATQDERYYRVSKNGVPTYLIQKNKLDGLFNVVDSVKE